MKTGIYCLDYCSMRRKTLICCPSHPETGESKIIKRGKLEFRACIALDEDGFCTQYESRPYECRAYECDKLISQGIDPLFFD